MREAMLTIAEAGIPQLTEAASRFMDSTGEAKRLAGKSPERAKEILTTASRDFAAELLTIETSLYSKR
jgi:phage shock protein A